VIIFSVRRHDPANSLYTGLFAGCTYLVLIALMAREGGIGAVLQSPEGLIVRTNLINELTKAVMLFVGGVVGYITARNFENVFLEGVRREREVLEVRHCFGQYVSHELVDEILSGRIPLEGEKREISILFMDIRGFTGLSEKLPPQLLLRVLNAYFGYVIEVVEQYGGFVDKFIGDAVMVVFGAPVHLGDHREKAVLCALELWRRRETLNGQVRDITGDETRIRFGIGVNTGEAVGNVGGEQRKDYTALGDAVNVAARLEALTKELDCPVVIGAEVFLPMFSPWFEGPLRVQLKGKSVENEVYRLKRDVL
jgi:adenylate cyclase